MLVRSKKNPPSECIQRTCSKSELYDKLGHHAEEPSFVIKPILHQIVKTIRSFRRPIARHLDHKLVSSIDSRLKLDLEMLCAGREHVRGTLFQKKKRNEPGRDAADTPERPTPITRSALRLKTPTERRIANSYPRERERERAMSHQLEKQNVFNSQ